jgi:hypothetical protein
MRTTTLPTGRFSLATRAAGGAVQSISDQRRQRLAWRSPCGTGAIGMSAASQRPFWK